MVEGRYASKGCHDLADHQNLKEIGEDHIPGEELNHDGIPTTEAEEGSNYNHEQVEVEQTAAHHKLRVHMQSQQGAQEEP